MKLVVAFVIVSLGLIGSAVFAATCDYNGCTYATAEVGVSEITFNSSGYFPSCIRVDAGDTVMFTGPFATYSLSNGYVADGTGNEVAVDNDLFNVTTGTTKNFTLTTLGLSAFFSPGNSGLKGVIYVGTTCAPVTPVAPPSTPVAAPTTPTAAPSTPTAAPATSPTTQSPVAAPSTPVAAPSATPDAGTPVDSPVDSNSPSSAPGADTPTDQSPSVSSPIDAPSTSAPRPKRVRVSSAAQVVSGIAVFAVIGVAML